MGTPRRRRSGLAGRLPMRSPGRPPVARREHRQRFWKAIAHGPVQRGRRRGVWRIAPARPGSALRAGSLPSAGTTAVAAPPSNPILASRIC
jgi:hypothetical protein